MNNIIEAFGKDFSTGTGVMAGRWLPELKSYGAYFPSSGLKADAAKKYQTDDFFNRVESLEYVEEALLFCIEKARAGFPLADCSSPERVVDLLHEYLTRQSAQLKLIEPAWDSLNRIRQERNAISEDLDQYIQDKNTSLLGCANEIVFLTQVKSIGSNTVRVSRWYMRSSPGSPPFALNGTIRLTISWTKRLAQE
ncbi:hypothetical protein [Buttiauxella noackiae]|uniref:hypothetical protein n=1 Tax=Buttiauxella noackiae TaxID=82992 RepID=UPI00240EED94|nr:hypothetical protein [Buttiauxella noackiae]